MKVTARLLSQTSHLTIWFSHWPGVPSSWGERWLGWQRKQPFSFFQSCPLEGLRIEEEGVSWASKPQRPGLGVQRWPMYAVWCLKSPHLCLFPTDHVLDSSFRKENGWWSSINRRVTEEKGGSDDTGRGSVQGQAQCGPALFFKIISPVCVLEAPTEQGEAENPPGSMGAALGGFSALALQRLIGGRCLLSELSPGWSLPIRPHGSCLSFPQQGPVRETQKSCQPDLWTQWPF